MGRSLVILAVLALIFAAVITANECPAFDGCLVRCLKEEEVAGGGNLQGRTVYDDDDIVTDPVQGRTGGGVSVVWVCSGQAM